MTKDSSIQSVATIHLIIIHQMIRINQNSLSLVGPISHPCLYVNWPGQSGQVNSRNGYVTPVVVK